jgi:SEC-C motif-containing protein
MPDALCACGSQKLYAECCGPFHSGDALPNTPEQLMRSRYSAYTMANADYIDQTMCGPAAIGFDKSEARQWAASVVWQGLEVKSAKQDGDKGEVTFIASFKEQGRLQQIKERSAFERIDGKWYYVDQVKPQKVGRNDPCPCGSGKKFKKCCAA